MTIKTDELRQVANGTADEIDRLRTENQYHRKRIDRLVESDRTLRALLAEARNVTYRLLHYAGNSPSAYVTSAMDTMVAIDAALGGEA